ncbi:T9SS type A sorting domain-containing protein [Epilithonimonas mollis]|uniref:Por secretion system C-terminal sorting domain-containing protein n=1 Tax=Epilithonimonas mollis TaxID=216903 RepID=A0A1M6NU35_9FLAO|nr:T9SS type A sorting domain-containing protein [Epilithonimonas mollis]SHJ99215.1 Por secretion system C-terminal sorting domain-containing protein [Epilithonimonas mollis]
MKKLLYTFTFFWVFALCSAQDNPLSFICANQLIDKLDIKSSNILDPEKLELNTTTCGNTSQYYSNNDYTYNHYNLYLPKSSDNIIYLKLNFIFLTKPDGTGNFEENNSEHVGFIDEVIGRVNQTLLNLDGSPTSGCEGYGQTHLTNTKIQFVINKIWKVDPAWDYLQTGYEPICPKQPCYNFSSTINPGSSVYYYSYYDNDPTIPQGINVIFANNGNVYNEMVNNHNYSMSGVQGWAASQNASKSDFSQKLRQMFPDVYVTYLWMKNVVADPNIPNPTPWETVRGWHVTNLRKGILHEAGHNFNLDHEEDCFTNIMKSEGTAPGNFLSNLQISKLYLAASTKSTREYFTEESFKNSNIDVTNNETWDLNFRLYSNVKIDNNASLKATCKIIMAPQSRFIVKDGSNFVIEGAEITSANNSTWNGIKVEGKGYLLINPNTLIDTNHFYAYADNTPLTGARSADSDDKTAKTATDNAVVEKDYRIYPNPTGDFINIETTGKISKVEIYNLLNKAFSSKYKDNRVDVRNLPPGNYILKIYGSSGERTIHFIKK